MNDTNNHQRRIQEDEEEATTSNSVDTIGIGNVNRDQPLLSLTNLLTTEDEEEQVVTSTSNENNNNNNNNSIRCPPYHTSTNDTADSALLNFITSPARITSSTGNDYSSSPTQQMQAREEVAHGILSSEDDSSEQQQQTISILKRARNQHQQQLNRDLVINAVMPTTSAAAAAAAASSGATSSTIGVNCKKGGQIDMRAGSSEGLLCNHTSMEKHQEAEQNQSSGIKNSDNIDKIAFSSTTNNMVTRDSSNNLANIDYSENPVEKIILKLPKHPQPSNSNESQPQTRSHQRPDTFADIDPTTSSSSNSSTNSSIAAEADTRKVEPLKINLHHGSSSHHHQHHHQTNQHFSPGSSTHSSGSGGTPFVPKITIKPLFKKSSAEANFSGNDGDANKKGNETLTYTSESQHGNNPIPKLTIKASGGSVGPASTGDSMNSHEPHILPKLTIRAAHEEGGCTLTSVVPKLTIKISDSQTSSHNVHNSLGSPTTSKLSCNNKNSTSELVQQPPLPKLTIKTTLDGSSGSSIMSSSISPALSSSNSSSSDAVSPQTSASSTIATSASTTISKLTIKTSSKGHDELPPVPKLTIKTSAPSSCVSSVETTDKSADNECASGSNSGNKIPKLTIKTGQERAVIITQHNDDQTIPKLTIKTKSLDVEESLSDLSEEPLEPEKIPKLTIKTASSESLGAGHIPKLMISSPNSPKSHNTTSLVVRQVNAVSSSPSASKTQSPDRVPKLLISRQDYTANHCTEILSEKAIPKLTIRTSSSGNERDEEIKAEIRPEKIPKLTIKTLPPQLSQSQHSSEESDDVPSPEFEHGNEMPKPNKMVPKLTIKNLGSPKLKLKSVLENPPPSMDTESATQKRSPKSSRQNVHLSQTTSEDRTTPKVVVVTNGGESSSSQEFCGFNDSTTESPSTLTTIGAHNPVEEITEQRRNSDDMDIDEGLQQHDPKIFKNLTHFSGVRNGESYGIHLNNNIDDLSQTVGAASANTQPFSKPIENSSQIVDTVDLTSSPSPGSSPAHFNYTDADPKIPELTQSISVPQTAANALLMDCLQRETSVIQAAPPTIMDVNARSQYMLPKENSNSLLLSQLTAPMRHPTLPPLHTRALPHMLNVSQSSLRYPQLTERLLANGAHLPLRAESKQSSTSPLIVTGSKEKSTTVIDSIEILDTPEGSPRSAQDDSQSSSNFNHIGRNNTRTIPVINEDASSMEFLGNTGNLLKDSQESLELNRNMHMKRTAKNSSNIGDDFMEIPAHKIRRTESLAPTMATLTILTNDQTTNSSTVITTSPTIISGINDNNQSNNEHTNNGSPKSSVQHASQSTSGTHRSRKQKHENLLAVPSDEMDAACTTNETQIQNQSKVQGENTAAVVATPPVRKRGRPRRIKIPEEQNSQTAAAAALPIAAPSSISPSSSAERRVQLLRKRLAIDMVAAEQPLKNAESAEVKQNETTIETPRRERAVRSSRRCATPNAVTMDKHNVFAQKQRKQRSTISTSSMAMSEISANFNSFGGSNSSISSACSSTSSNAVATSAGLSQTAGAATVGMTNCVFSMSSQMDLTMSSSSSMMSLGSTTITMAGAGGVQSCSNSMLPPTKALSSTDPLPDVIFRSQDFSAIMLAQQSRLEDMSPLGQKINYRANSQDGGGEVSGCGSGSGDDSMSVFSPIRTPGRGRGRGRGRGSRGAMRAHRLGRGASAVAKAIAMSRPRCVGALKHTPDPERMKGLFSPSPQVFEEDTRMSADMSQISMMSSEFQTPIKQNEFLLTEEESQSSIMSNTSVSILDPNTVAAVQNGASIKRPKKKKMEVCAADETEYTVASIAEYDWPPPKGCCPSKNRDTFMIQEQVANYLGIKSFKRKYPDLPRRQVDMEERNWLQEKGLVSEKMCDLGITAVWASDILDIMYADFYEKYEEYKDYVRQKHVREIESKQKALGLHVSGRGLQIRDRAMLSASKWNAYFNKSKKDERVGCLDLQTLTVNLPLPAHAPAATILSRSLGEDIARAASSENVEIPPSLQQPDVLRRPTNVASYYPLSVVPGQFAEPFKKYTYKELSCLPVSTVLKYPWTRQDAATTPADETDSANETADVIKKRSKIRLSRRARSERSSKKLCDIKMEDGSQAIENINLLQPLVFQDKDGVNVSESDEIYTSSSSSESATSASSSSSESSSSCSESETESSTETPAACSVCQRPQNRNLKDLPEIFIKCYTCRRKVHPSCIEMPHRMTQRVRNYNWQCVDCKCCIKCKRKQDANKMLYCEQCDRGFHIYCLGVKTVPDGRWSCERCSVCMRCGATKPEGQTQQQQQLFSSTGEKIKQIKHKKVKWINEYRIDHITKLREHCSMLCVPCGRARTTNKRLQLSCGNSNISRNSSLSPSVNVNVPHHQQQQQHVQQTQQLSTLTNSTACSTNSPNFSSSNAVATNAANDNSLNAPSKDIAASTANSTTTTTTLPPPAVVA